MKISKKLAAGFIFSCLVFSSFNCGVQTKDLIDYSLLKEEVAKAAKKAFLNIKQQHPEETLYGFALFTDDNAWTIGAVANSDKSLKETAREYAEDGMETKEEYIQQLRYFPNEWSYYESGIGSFSEVYKLLNARTSSAKDNYIEWEKTFRAFVEGLKQLDNENFFIEERKQKDFRLLVVSTDPGQWLVDLMSKWEKELNPQ